MSSLLVLWIVTALASAKAACVNGDPHFIFAHGGRADLKGEDGATYNLVSARNFSLAALFQHASFNINQNKLVHGSFMYSAYIRVRTMWTGRIIDIAFEASKGLVATIYEAGKASHVTTGQAPFVAENLKVLMDGRTLTVTNGQWDVKVTSKVQQGINASTCKDGRCTMNIAAGPAAGYDVDSDPVAPHGIIGQTYDRDNIAVDGKIDDYHADVVYTSAMAEGAIEGKAADYKLAGKFDTNFKFSVFSASKAAPRDVTKLSGTQRYVGSGKPQRTGAFSDGVNLEMVLVEEDGIDGRRLDDCDGSTAVQMTLTVEGEPDDYAVDTTVHQQMRETIATKVGVSADDVNISVQSAGSVVLIIKVNVPVGVSVNAVTTAMTTSLGTLDAAESLLDSLGVEVLSVTQPATDDDVTSEDVGSGFE